VSPYELSVICQSALSTKKAPTVILRNSSGKLGAPSMIRTCSRDGEGVARLELESGGRNQTNEVGLVRPA
jgi:hypothetical protein